MGNAIGTFKRVEKKYLLTRGQTAALLPRLSAYMAVDRYGKHTIENIYYDTEEFELIRASLDKPVYKEKLRVRSYGVPQADGEVFVELKKKFDGVVYKRRTAMTLREAERFLRFGLRPAHADGQIVDEIAYAVNLYGAQPMMCVAYDRVAMAGRQDAAFRLTLDRAIRYRTDDLSLASGSYGTLLLPDDAALMEVKTEGALPLWFARLLSECGAYPTTFSKYGMAYRDMRGRAGEAMRVA